MEVPFTFARFTRFEPRLDRSFETTCAPGPMQSARLCGAAASRGRYTRMDGSRPSRGDEKSSYSALYLKYSF